jgi:uncharacterized membrane protein
MPTAGDEPEDFSGENDARLIDRVASLEVQVDDLNHTIDNLTNEFVRLRLKLESTKTALEDSLVAVASAEAVKADVVVATPPPEVVAVTPPPPPPQQVVVVAAETPVAAKVMPTRNLEERLGSQVFNAIGILALVFGVSWALKLAIEHGLIGPTGRVMIGLATGAGLVLWSERFRRKGFAAFSYSLKAVGSAILYLSLWAAFHLYQLLPAGAAMTAMVVVTAWNAFMAWSQDSELLAVYAVVGGFLTPLLVSSGGDHETFLFTYIAAIDAATAMLVRLKPWRRLLAISFPVTVAYFIGYFVGFFHTTPSWDGQSSETAAFALVFAALFGLVSVQGWVRSPEAGEKDVSTTVLSVLLPLANAAFLGSALYSVMEDSGLHEGLAWVAVALAAVYLAAMRVQATSVGRAVHLAIAVVMLTIAIPLKASGHTLTTAWLVEGIVLFWLSTRFSEEEAQAAGILRGLAVSGYALGLASLYMHWTFLNYAPASFFNANLASALIAVGSLSGAVVIARQKAMEQREARRRVVPQLVLALTAIDAVGVGLVSNEIISRGVIRPAFASIDFADAVVGLAALAATMYAAYRLAEEDRRGRERLLGLAGATMVMFNLAAILTMVNEIDNLFTSTDAGLRQSLSTSAFLMVYGAALLALGFWRRMSFIRWQALILLTFTIAKVFLYDTWGLSQGYRPASFIGLGALLMAVSFAYQKDWLSLREKTTEEAHVEQHGDPQ